MPIKKTEKQELLEKLSLLLNKQSLFQQEINELQLQITSLQVDDSEKEAPVKAESVEQISTDSVISERKEIKKIIQQRDYKKKKSVVKEKKKSAFGSEIEKFIGENLISKIGIGVLIIGVGIGAKYAIDNNLISPLVRILLGYLVGFTLNFFAIRLKKKYFNFSAVLASGAMAIHYFISYAAFTYYGLIPQPLTFALMVLITVITVALALHYNRQVIAHFGLVGAYVVPFLLKDPDSSILVLLFYVALVNCGILFISTRKSWKWLNYLAFLSTWVIFTFWFSSKAYDSQLGLSLTFASIFFVQFYFVFLSYKLILKEKLRIDDIVFLILNSGMYYIVGTIALEISELSNEYLALFSLVNAIIHAFTAYLIYRFEREDKKLFYWIVGLGLTFFTISIPIQFNNYILAVLWAVEAFVLYWFSRKKNNNFVEVASYVLLSVLFFVAVINWSGTYNFYVEEIKKLNQLIFNSGFLSSMGVIIFTAALFYIQIKMNKTERNPFGIRTFYNIIVPVILLLLVFFTFFSETSLFWNNVQVKTCYEQNTYGVWVKQFEKVNPDVFRFKTIWLVNYCMLFVSLLSYINFRWFKNIYTSALNLLFAGIFSLIFLASCLGIFGELRENYLIPGNNPDFDAGIFHLLIRYISYLFFAVMLFAFYRFVIPMFKEKAYKTIFEVALSIILITIFSSELVNILDLSGAQEVDKIALSILWGVFSFLLVGYGIWRKNKYLRITAIALFGFTLIKLFFYDLSNLSTVQKTIVFVLVGALLLIVSFMYNKYRKLIFGNE